MLKIIKPALSVIVLLCLLGSVVPSVAAQDDPTIYFYNPEISTTRNLVLKTTFDRYFQQNSSLFLQPVAEKETFHQLLKEHQDSFFILSSWHYQALGHASGMQVVFRGQKDGTDTFYKLFIGTSDSLLNSREPITVATSVSESRSARLLDSVLTSDSANLINRVTWLIVPKDIDALMSVGFGMADAALASEASLETLSMVYRDQYRKLHVLGKTLPLKRLVIIASQEALASHPEFIKQIDNMSRGPKGKLGLKLLGLDGWKQVNHFSRQQRRAGIQ